MFLQKKFSKIFKFFVSSGFDQSSLFFDRSKWQKENSVLSLNSWVASIPLDQLNLFLQWFSIPSRFLSTDRNWKFLVFSFLINLSFHASFLLGFTCVALFSLSILHFCSHISHCFHTRHAYTAKFGTQLDLKVDWLIFELCTF